MIENFKDHNYEGLTTYFYPDGKVKIEANYFNDNLQGDYKEYDSSGKLIIDRKYEDDVLPEEK